MVREGGAARRRGAADVLRQHARASALRRACAKETLYAPQAGALVVELSSEADLSGRRRPWPLWMLGRTSGTADVKPWTGSACSLEELVRGLARAPWRRSSPNNWPIHGARGQGRAPVETQRENRAPAIKAAPAPGCSSPPFPGTNCEVDSARAFEKAGAECEILVVKNLSVSDIEETIDRMEKAIRRAQIVMLPGGFSGGDEPEGCGKFIATTFRNPRIAQAVTDLLEARDGLMLGICNGFQALIKLGLVPYGKITEPKEDDPTLTFNTLGRHVSRMVYTRVTSVKSPWMAGVNAGDIFTVPVSHGEGRFVADDKALRKLIENGQVATQYVDADGTVSGDIQWNPNGSVCAIEGITSPDGRVLGKMGHSERKGTDLYKNVPGEKDQLLFESGVKYFK